MFFVGVTRFSLFYPHAPGWNLTGAIEDPLDYQRALFAPQRLDPRVQIFTQMSLPQLEVAAEGLDYIHIVQISPQLPQPAKEVLRKAQERYAFLRLSEQPSAKLHREELDNEIRRYAKKVDSADGVFARFRLDDDDLLGVDYFQNLSTYVRPAFIGMNVSFGKGYQAVFHGGVVFNARALYHPRNSMGMAQICRVRSSGRIEWKEYSNHARSDLDVPTILDSRWPAVLSLKHNGQDTFANQDVEGGYGKATRLLAAEEVVDYLDLLGQFPALEPFTVERVNCEVKLDKGTFPTPITTNAQAVRFQIEGSGMFELDLLFESVDVNDDQRLFVALPIRPRNIVHPWSEFQTDSIVAGVPFGGRSHGRLPLLLESGERVESATVWQSRASSSTNILSEITIRGKSADE